jgi:hypothetical protein
MMPLMLLRQRHLPHALLQLLLDLPDCWHCLLMVQKQLLCLEATVPPLLLLVLPLPALLLPLRSPALLLLLLLLRLPALSLLPLHLLASPLLLRPVVWSVVLLLAHACLRTTWPQATSLLHALESVALALSPQALRHEA